MGLVDRLFVYGSLRTGQSARELVEPYVKDWEPATVRGSMYAFPSGYPGVVLDPKGGIIMGELLHLRELATCMPRVDAYEGHDYLRELVQVEHVGGPSWAWIYVLADPRVTALGTPVPGGEWIAQVVGADAFGSVL
ncbi:MAG TPA: gamma-glutamylcyclotransferase family protein [Kofleriaceae bacterium]|nr:gamma-glutamylcyclotransferase family protein [Kofleriaceae bacterium]